MLTFIASAQHAKEKDPKADTTKKPKGDKAAEKKAPDAKAAAVKKGDEKPAETKKRTEGGKGTLEHRLEYVCNFL